MDSEEFNLMVKSLDITAGGKDHTLSKRMLMAKKVVDRQQPLTNEERMSKFAYWQMCVNTANQAAIDEAALAAATAKIVSPKRVKTGGQISKKDKFAVEMPYLERQILALEHGSPSPRIRQMFLERATFEQAFYKAPPDVALDMGLKVLEQCRITSESISNADLVNEYNKGNKKI